MHDNIVHIILSYFNMSTSYFEIIWYVTAGEYVCRMFGMFIFDYVLCMCSRPYGVLYYNTLKKMLYFSAYICIIYFM